MVNSQDHRKMMMTIGPCADKLTCRNLTEKMDLRLIKCLSL